MTPFGPQLIGETEKTLDALLHRLLDGTGLTEPQWVTLRIAGQIEEPVGDAGLAAAVAERAHFADSEELVRRLSQRGLLEDGRLAPSGRDLVTTVQARITTTTAPIWDSLPAADVEATTRVLNEVVARARAILA